MGQHVWSSDCVTATATPAAAQETDTICQMCRPQCTMRWREHAVGTGAGSILGAQKGQRSVLLRDEATCSARRRATEYWYTPLYVDDISTRRWCIPVECPQCMWQRRSLLQQRGVSQAKHARLSRTVTVQANSAAANQQYASHTCQQHTSRC